MNALQLIELIKSDFFDRNEETPSNQQIVYALEDGEYLSDIGLTDDDQEVVEEAYSIVCE